MASRDPWPSTPPATRSSATSKTMPSRSPPDSRAQFAATSTSLQLNGKVESTETAPRLHLITDPSIVFFLYPTHSFTTRSDMSIIRSWRINRHWFNQCHLAVDCLFAITADRNQFDPFPCCCEMASIVNGWFVWIWMNKGLFGGYQRQRQWNTGTDSVTGRGTSEEIHNGTTTCRVTHTAWTIPTRPTESHRIPPKKTQQTPYDIRTESAVWIQSGNITTHSGTRDVTGFPKGSF